jgi:hypothetical protein
MLSEYGKHLKWSFPRFSETHDVVNLSGGSLFMEMWEWISDHWLNLSAYENSFTRERGQQWLYSMGTCLPMLYRKEDSNGSIPWGPACLCSIANNPNTWVLFTTEPAKVKVYTPKAYSIKNKYTLMTSRLCLFLVEPKTQITQFLIHLNLTIKLYPFLCTDTHWSQVQAPGGARRGSRGRQARIQGRIWRRLRPTCKNSLKLTVNFLKLEKIF